MAFLTKQRWKILIFHADFKKTKNALAFSKKYFKTVKITDQKDKRMWKNFYFISFWKKNWPKKSRFKFCVSQIIAIFGHLGILL